MYSLSQKYRKYQPGGTKNFEIPCGHRFQRRLRPVLEAVTTGDLKLFGTAWLVFATLLRETVAS